MWEMPYQAEHHRYLALPFCSRARTQQLESQLKHVGRHGYLGVHRAFLGRAGKTSATGQACSKC